LPGQVISPNLGLCSFGGFNGWFEFLVGFACAGSDDRGESSSKSTDGRPARRTAPRLLPPALRDCPCSGTHLQMARGGICPPGRKTTSRPGGLPAMIARPRSQRSKPCRLCVTRPRTGCPSVSASCWSTPASSRTRQVRPSAALSPHLARSRSMAADGKGAAPLGVRAPDGLASSSYSREARAQRLPTQLGRVGGPSALAGSLELRRRREHPSLFSSCCCPRGGRYACA
jgi:hypothetical protein